MSDTIREIRNELERRKGARAQTVKNAEKARVDIKSLERQERDSLEAQTIIQTVAQATQQELEYHVAEMVSLALGAIFPDPYTFHLDFTLRRNRSEADLSFSRGDSEEDERIHPLSASGGGAVDVAAFALRVASWNLERPRTRACLILDEPFRFLSRGLQERASRMVADLAERLGIQFIIVTHEETLIDAADKIITISQRRGRSLIS